MSAQDCNLSFVVVGSPRSGTTLVQRLACEVAGVVMPAETHFLDLFLPSLLRRGGFPLDGPRLRSELLAWSEMAHAAGQALDVELVVDQLGGRCASPGELFGAMMRVLAPDGSLRGEKTPAHLRWWRPLLRYSPETRIIAVVRDPRATVASTLTSPWVSQVQDREWTLGAHVVIAEQVCHDLRLLADLSSRADPRCLVLSYERIVADPDGARDAIAHLLGAPPVIGPPDLRPSVASTEFVLPWERDWKARALEDVTTSSVDAWRQRLPRDQAAVVTGLCLRPMRALGYSVGVREAARGRAAVARLGPSGLRSVRGLRTGLVREQGLIDAVTL